MKAETGYQAEEHFDWVDEDLHRWNLHAPDWMQFDLYPGVFICLVEVWGDEQSWDYEVSLGFQ